MEGLRRLRFEIARGLIDSAFVRCHTRQWRLPREYNVWRPVGFGSAPYNFYWRQRHAGRVPHNSEEAGKGKAATSRGTPKGASTRKRQQQAGRLVNTEEHGRGPVNGGTRGRAHYNSEGVPGWLMPLGIFGRGPSTRRQSPGLGTVDAAEGRHAVATRGDGVQFSRSRGRQSCDESQHSKGKGYRRDACLTRRWNSRAGRPRHYQGKADLRRGGATRNCETNPKCLSDYFYDFPLDIVFRWWYDG